MDTIILDPVIPYVGPIAGGSFSPKKLVKLNAAIPPNAYGFDLNLQCGPNTFPHDDIALQISARFLNGYIILNSLHDGVWGKEIRLPNVPIEADQNFKITVLCEFNQYKITINDEHYCIFPQRIRCEKVSHLSIDGDVSITQISYESICDPISDGTAPLPLTINQFNDVQDSESPPSYDTVMNCNEDVESQNLPIARVAIFHFRYKMGSPLQANLKSGCKTLFKFFCIIAVLIMIGYIIFLISKYGRNDARENSYNFDIPSDDFNTLDLLDNDKFNKEINDAWSKRNKIDENNNFFSDLHLVSNLKPEIY